MATESIRDPIVVSESEIEGVYGHFLNEGPFIPIYKETGSEKIHAGENNSFIILGRDRDGHGAEGVGGMGGTACGSIDLIAGLGGHDYKAFVKKQIQTGKESKTGFSVDKRRTDPNFFMDAARVYITEKGNIDNYFGLAQGSEMVGQSIYKSAVGIKADHVRLVGREHIKIVTGKARLENGGTYGEKNSGGGNMEFAGKIDLIAGNYTDPEDNNILNIFGAALSQQKTVRKLQPIPKGDNLRELLERILDHISDLSEMSINNTDNISSLISIFQAHVHETNVPFGPTSPAIVSGITAMGPYVSTFTNQVLALVLTFNVIVNKITFLTPLFSTYINSRFVNTT